MIIGINPYTQSKLYDKPELSSSEIETYLEQAQHAFNSWKLTTLAERQALFLKLQKRLDDQKEDLAKHMIAEIGKPKSQALAELEKCAWLCEYYIENAPSQLEAKPIKTDAKTSYVSYEPLGIVLAVMPWNYPFWQVFRFLVPNLMVGNVGVLKHASNVQESAKAIEKLLLDCGFPLGAFQNLCIKSQQVEQVIRHKQVKAVTLTGSEKAGKAVASLAGKHLKKSVLELGGSNALVVFDDCDITSTVKTCVQARFQNNGQSCIAGKRLLVHDTIYDQFKAELISEIQQLKTGDPNQDDTYISVMAREDLAEELEQQLQDSVKDGAKILIGGQRNRAFFEPTLVEAVTPEMPLFAEETFGPVLSMTRFSTSAEAVDLVNASSYGLGVSMFTANQHLINSLIPQFEDGAVFVNELVKSDPRLPFGGTKQSGYGRELSKDGILEFVNKKTVYIK